VRIQGNSAEVNFILYRLQHPGFSQLFNEPVIVNSGVPTDFDKVFPVPAPLSIVDNTRYTYFLFVQCGQQPTTISRITVNYRY
jgi:hypothetical protein